jgi:hypothetical protein
MNKIEEFSDERQKAWCIYCGEHLGSSETNQDHIPSKTLLIAPYPEHHPIIEVCKRCNSGFSADEEYFALFLEAVLAGSTDAPFAHNPKISRAFSRHKNLKSRIDKAKIEYETLGGERKILWKPEIERIKRVVLKNARGHAAYEFGEPMLDEPRQVYFVPLVSMTEEQRIDFENSDSEHSLFPEVGSRMMTRIMTNEDLENGWVIVQDDIYRYSVTHEGSVLRVKSVLREYLATEVLWS